MKTRHIAVFALCVFIGSLLLAATAQGGWLRTAGASAALFAVLLVVLLLSVLFAQTSVACIGILVAFAAGLGHYSAFLGTDVRMTSAVVFTACLYLPMFCTFLAIAPECPPVSPTGLFRFLMTLSFLPVCLVVYAILSLADPPNGIETVILHGVAPWFPIALPGFVACVAAGAYLAVRRQERPEKGQWFTAALALGAVAMAFRSTLWSPDAQPAMLLWNAVGALVILIGAALDAGWRHANVDELTQLPSRRPLLDHMQRLESPYVLAVIDIDRFKSVNDRFGHDVGDQVLRFVATRLREIPAAGAAAYRYGGEEFVVVLPGHDAVAALPVLEDLRQRVAGQPFVLRGPDRPATKPAVTAPRAAEDRSIGITVSVGFAAGDERRESPSDVLIAADKALYQAKETGRNKVVRTG